jgi:hypothetical protein
MVAGTALGGVSGRERKNENLCDLSACAWHKRVAKSVLSSEPSDISKEYVLFDLSEDTTAAKLTVVIGTESSKNIKCRGFSVPVSGGSTTNFVPGKLSSLGPPMVCERATVLLLRDWRNEAKLLLGTHITLVWFSDLSTKTLPPRRLTTV